MTLNDFRDLLERLENSRAKNRRGNKGKRRNPSDVKKSIEGRGIPKRELRPGFTQPGGGLDFSGLDRPISSVKEKPGGGLRTMEFRDRNGNRIDDRDEPGGSHYNEEVYKRKLQRQEERKTKKAAKKEPARGRNNDAKSPAGRGKGKDFEKMLRSRMSGY
jgi:hypothetical protein